VARDFTSLWLHSTVTPLWLHWPTWLHSVPPVSTWTNNWPHEVKMWLKNSDFLKPKCGSRFASWSQNVAQFCALCQNVAKISDYLKSNVGFEMTLLWLHFHSDSTVIPLLTPLRFPLLFLLCSPLEFTLTSTLFTSGIHYWLHEVSQVSLALTLKSKCGFRDFDLLQAVAVVSRLDLLRLLPIVTYSAYSDLLYLILHHLTLL
jgi:hypothetical protein